MVVLEVPERPEKHRLSDFPSNGVFTVPCCLSPNVVPHHDIGDVNILAMGREPRQPRNRKIMPEWAVNYLLVQLLIVKLTLKLSL